MLMLANKHSLVYYCSDINNEHTRDSYFEGLGESQNGSVIHDLSDETFEHFSIVLLSYRLEYQSGKAVPIAHL